MNERKNLSFTLVSSIKLSDQHISFPHPQPPEAVARYSISQGLSFSWIFLLNEAESQSQFFYQYYYQNDANGNLRNRTEM